MNAIIYTRKRECPRDFPWRVVDVLSPTPRRRAIRLATSHAQGQRFVRLVFLPSHERIEWIDGKRAGGPKRSAVSTCNGDVRWNGRKGGR